MGCAGHPVIQTPTLDQLADAGVRFTRAYSGNPVCIPARRSLMTGTTSRTHGDRCFAERLEMPDVPTLARTFREAGYQAYAVGKLHVYPQRSRIGFDDVMLHEESRHHLGLSADDYEQFLAEAGYPGQPGTHAMGNNTYTNRPWHLPEHCHPTNWMVRETCRYIRRRDPTRPAFWYVSFNHPHPPLAPLRDYLEMYRQLDVDQPVVGDWAADRDALPYALRLRSQDAMRYNDDQIAAARRAFYALCTHIDHQIRLIIGTLREEGLLDDTIIALTCDHGDMLGNHGLWAKRVFYEWSANIPMIVVPAAGDRRLGHHRVDDRLVELRDVMPTLLDLAGIRIPDTVEGISMLGDKRREYLFGELDEADTATRMVHDGRWKLIYYAVGNRFQLFDVQGDPLETRDLADEPEHAPLRERLTRILVENLYGSDSAWLSDGRLVGVPDKRHEPAPERTLQGQRGWRFM